MEENQTPNIVKAEEAIKANCYFKQCQNQAQYKVDDKSMWNSVYNKKRYVCEDHLQQHQKNQATKKTVAWIICIILILLILILGITFFIWQFSNIF